MLLQKRNHWFGQGLLLITTVIWGSTFIILKDALDSLPVMLVLAVRFLPSALILLALFWKRIKRTNKKTFGIGVLLGGILAVAYLFQGYGLKDTSAGESAFLTSTYTVIVPFMCWIFFKRRPDAYNFIAGIVCIAGIACVVVRDGTSFSFGTGQLLTIGCAIFYGLQIIVLAKFIQEEDTISLLFWQILTVGIVCGIGSCCFELGRTEIVLSADAVWRVVYLTLVGTLGALTCQMIGQKYVSAEQTSILFSFESVFGLLFSALAGRETLTVISCIGFSLVFLSVIISETKLRFITKRWEKKNLTEEKDPTSD